MIVEDKIEIPTAGGTAEGILFRREEEGRWPGVILYTDIGGIRPSQQEMARQLAGAGYVVLMPNVFYRTGALPLFDFPLKFGEERTTKRLAELSSPLTPQTIACDASDYVDFSRAARFRQTRPDGRRRILLHRQDGGLYRDVATGQNSSGSLIPWRRARQ